MMRCRICKVIVAAFLLSLLSGVSAFAGAVKADFYLSPAGDDSNQGTIHKPFATLSRARDAVRTLKKTKQTDITVLIRGGIYYLKETVVFGLDDSGNKNQLIIYGAYPGEEPVLSAGVKVTGWKKVNKALPGLPSKAKGKVWMANVPKKLGRFFTLYDGGQRLQRARSKASAPTKHFDFHDEGVPFTTDYVWPVRDTLHFPKGTLKNWSNLEDVEIVIRPHNQWVLNILTLRSVDENSLLAKTTIEGTYPLGKLSKRQNRSFWVENVLDALDEPGEWVLNMQEGKLYLWPKGDEPGANILAPCLKELVKVEGDIDEAGPVDRPVKNLVFRGLKFTHGNRDTWTQDDKGIQHDWEMYDKGSALVRFRGAEKCVIDRCEFSNSGGTGVRLDLHCQHNRVSNSIFKNLGCTGILLCGYGPGTKDVNKRNEILNNSIHDCGEIYWHGFGILLWQSGENRITHNLIYNMPYTGIGICGCRPHFFKEPFKSGWREVSSTIRWDEVGSACTWEDTIPFLHCKANIVEENELHNLMEVLGDGNAIYASGTGPFNVIRRNYVHDVSKGFMIRTDGWQRDTLITENIIYDCAGGIIRKNYNHVENNVIVNMRGNKYIMFAGFPGEKLTISSRIQRNILYHSGKASQFYVIKKKILTNPKDCDADYNLFYCEGRPEAGYEFIEKMQRHGIEKHSVSADPLFVDLENGDFRLKPNSPALKLGFKQIDIAKIGLQEDLTERFRKGVLTNQSK